MGGDTSQQRQDRRVAAIKVREKEQAVIDKKVAKKKLKRRNAMYIAMKHHENFEMPEAPGCIATKASMAAAEYAIDCAIALISPKQVAGESNNIECVDVIDILKNELLPEIIKQL